MKPDNFKPVKITEGGSTFYVPETGHKKGPASKAPVFFNPAMKGNRDVSVLYARAFGKDRMKILDGLGGCGARGLRIYEEAPHDINIHINEWNKPAFELLQKNVNKWEREDRITLHQKDLNCILASKRFDWVDIDPFGSPVSFLDAAVQSVKDGGTLSVTATDTAPLCGTYSKACIRRYGARPLRTAIMHEVGLRILVGNAIKRAATFDIALFPLLSYYSGHYFRCYFTKKNGAKVADSQLAQIGYILKEKSGEYRTSKWPEKGKQFGGPLWLGPLSQPDCASALLKHLDATISEDTKSLLTTLSEELPEPPFHYNTDEVASHLQTLPPGTKKIVDALRDCGFSASLVHYNTKAFRTNASWLDIETLLLQSK